MGQTLDGQEVFIDRHVVGVLQKTPKGIIFVQKVRYKHIFRQYNGKGIDINVHHQLKGRCDYWRIEFRDTKQVLEIPFGKIEQVGIKYDTGAGVQLIVKLEDFNEERPVLQERLI